MNIAPYAKAYVGALTAGVALLAGFLVNDTSLGDITTGQWAAVVLAVLGGLGFVYAVPNKPAP